MSIEVVLATKALTALLTNPRTVGVNRGQVSDELALVGGTVVGTRHTSGMVQLEDWVWLSRVHQKPP